MRWKIMGVLALLALSAGTALMQDATEIAQVPGGEAVIYEPETGALYTISADGTQSGATALDMPAFSEQTLSIYTLSPDHKTLFFVTDELTAYKPSKRTLYSADVASGACCETFDPQDPVINNVIRMIFSPDGTQIAASYYSNKPSYEPVIAGQIVVFDAATREVVARLDGTRLDNSRFANSVLPSILLIRWIDEGLMVAASCCLWADGQAQVWNPVDDSLSAANVPYNLDDQRLWTGETVRATFDPTFPSDPEDHAVDESNVVTYVPAPADLTTRAMDQVIFFNPDNLFVNYVHWIADGQAVFVEQGDLAEWYARADDVYILLRDGTQIPLTVPQTREFLYGTRDGWVMTDYETHRYVWYRLSGATVEEIVLEATYAENSHPVVVEMPKLGASLQDAMPFPQITVP